MKGFLEGMSEIGKDVDEATVEKRNDDAEAPTTLALCNYRMSTYYYTCMSSFRTHTHKLTLHTGPFGRFVWLARSGSSRWTNARMTRSVVTSLRSSLNLSSLYLMATKTNGPI